MKYWVGVASLDHVRAGVAGGFCQLGHGKHAAVARLNPGDGIVYYSPKTEMGAGEPVQAFTAIGEVLVGEIYEGSMGGSFMPARRDVRYYDATDAPIRPLLNRLSFTQGRTSWGYAFRRGMFTMSEADYAIIAAAMGINP